MKGAVFAYNAYLRTGHGRGRRHISSSSESVPCGAGGLANSSSACRTFWDLFIFPRSVFSLQLAEPPGVKPAQENGGPGSARAVSPETVIPTDSHRRVFPFPGASPTQGGHGFRVVMILLHSSGTPTTPACQHSSAGNASAAGCSPGGCSPGDSSVGHPSPALSFCENKPFSSLPSLANRKTFK